MSCDDNDDVPFESVPRSDAENRALEFVYGTREVWEQRRFRIACKFHEAQDTLPVGPFSPPIASKLLEIQRVGRLSVSSNKTSDVDELERLVDEFVTMCRAALASPAALAPPAASRPRVQHGVGLLFTDEHNANLQDPEFVRSMAMWLRYMRRPG